MFEPVEVAFPFISFQMNNDASGILVLIELSLINETVP
jgi:hypothetical protein